MDNKLSELSKPVAYDYQIAGACIADGHNENGQWVHWRNELSLECPPDWMIEEGQVKDLKPRYSQEYVSALIKQAEKAEAFRDQMVRYVVGLGTSVIDPTVVETILTAAERSKHVGGEQ